MIGLYVHIPFCDSKCPYCDFYSIKAKTDKKEKYVQAVLKEMKMRGGKKIANTLYFGGGTPTLLESSQLGKIVKCAVETYGLSYENEITVESNPNTLTDQKLFDLKKVGINRLSIGLQSGREAELKALGRRHSLDQVKRVIKSAKLEGFDNISVDMIIGAPGQTLKTIFETLNFVESLDVQHCSFYQLKIEPKTPFGLNKPNNIASEDEIAEIYLTVVRQLKKIGFYQYEISNFAKTSKESVHNLKYWNQEEYIGFGPGAHSFVNGFRYFHDRNIDGYIDDVMQVEKEKVLDANFEWIMLRLRLTKGVSVSELEKRGFWNDDLILKIKKLEGAKYIERKYDRIALTPAGMMVQNAILLNLFR